ncbi:MAG: hypothetical protein DBX55_08985 [Verrucomicrobia bacterium]|nr:MAG: hypothetical protein DBX55_08985 [Verrucomicrobiota bacterium]
MRGGIGGDFRFAGLKIARVDCLNMRKCVCARGILFGKIFFISARFSPRLAFANFVCALRERKGKRVARLPCGARDNV